MAVGIPEARPTDMAWPFCLITSGKNNPGSVLTILYPNN